VPTAICFGTKVPPSGSLLTTNDRISNTCFRCQSLSVRS